MQSDFYHIIFWENDDEASNFQINIKDKSKEIVVEMKILIWTGRELKWLRRLKEDSVASARFAVF